jgi:hypothetical protein
LSAHIVTDVAADLVLHHAFGPDTVVHVDPGDHEIVVG